MRVIYTVGQVNRYIRSKFTSDGILSGIYVCGEVSNCKYHSSGHLYFTLKDDSGAISCVMFAGNVRQMTFRMKNGDRIVAGGRIDVYERTGSYQLYAREIQLEGAGLFYERLIRLKKKLEAEGLFDSAHKKPLPRYALRVGVVTAPTGSVIRDIQKISHRRNPYVEVILCPAQVQGDGAAQSIVHGIRALDGLVDVLIIGRGGGSNEDLGAFNEESVARAIYECATPVISAVGHGTDATIADLVADRNTATPSEAAELAVFDLDTFRQDLRKRKESLSNSISNRVHMAKLRADAYNGNLRAHSPGNMLMKQKMRAADLDRVFGDRMERRLREAEERRKTAQRELSKRMPLILAGNRERLNRLASGSLQALEAKLLRRRHSFEVYLAVYEAQNPLKKLSSGYSFVENEAGRAVKSVAQVRTGEDVNIHVTDGIIVAEVTETEKKSLTESGTSRFPE